MPLIWVQVIRWFEPSYPDNLLRSVNGRLNGLYPFYESSILSLSTVKHPKWTRSQTVNLAKESSSLSLHLYSVGKVVIR